MADVEIKKIKCASCKEDFDIEVYNIINVGENPELRGKIMDDSLFIHTCPKCGNKHFLFPSVIYHDPNRKFMIQSGNLPDLLEGKEVMKNNAAGMNQDFLKDYSFFGATSLPELKGKIIILEHGLDPRYVVTMIEYEALNYLKLAKENPNFGRLLDVFIAESNDGKIIFDLRAERSNGDVVSFPRPFNNDLYNELKNNKELFDGTDPFLFETFTAEKILGYNEEERRIARNYDHEIAVLEYGNNKLMASIEEINVGKFLPGDHVVFTVQTQNDKNIIGSAIVSSIIHTTDYAFPYDISKLGVVLVKEVKTELNASRIEGYNPNNNELINNIRRYIVSKFDPQFVPLPLASADFILCSLDGEDNYTVHKDGQVEYLAIYSDQTHVPAYITGERKVCRFGDIVKYILGQTSRYAGVVINPELEKVVLGTSDLIHYMFTINTFFDENMKALIKSLNDVEKNYLGTFAIDALKKIYIDNKSMDDTRREMNIGQHGMEQILSLAFIRLKYIVISRMNN